ncbi:MAG: permease [Firmicutes bacterium]|nr:permease [Bacillota bacterium]
MNAALIKAGQTLLNLAPYIILGTLAGEILKLTSWTSLIRRWIAKAPLISVFCAAGLGIISPLCTYGTIPVVIQLFNTGVHIAPLATFLAASSLMNPQLFIMTWGGIGLEMALVRVGAVLIFGVILGVILYRLPRSWVINPNLGVPDKDRVQTENSRSGKLPPANFGAGKFPNPPFPFRWESFIRNNLATLQYVGFYMLIGIISGAIIEVYVPGHLAALLFKGNRWGSIFAAALLGIPLYACGGGTIPLILALLREGMSKGAALAFFIVGPATRSAPLVALASILRPLFIAIYVFLLILFAVITGVFYNSIFPPRL